VTVHLGPLIVDAADPEAVTTFWESALGQSSCRRHLVVRPQRRAKVVKNRVHLDVYVRDVTAPADGPLVDPGGNEVSAPGREMPAG
jgi:Glyoxalase-like domain